MSISWRLLETPCSQLERYFASSKHPVRAPRTTAELAPADMNDGEFVLAVERQSPRPTLR